MPTEIKFIGVPEPVLKRALSDLSGWRIMGDRMLELSKRNCPVGTNQELGASFGQEHEGEHLRDSMKVKYEYGLDPRILIGSEMVRGDERVSALGLILEGTESHPIDPKTDDGVLRFVSGGQVVFTKHVEHPGTKKNPFVQRAIRTVVLESVVL